MIPWLKDFIRGQRILVEEGAEGRIELRELSSETGGAFEEGFYANSPKFLVIGGRIGVEQIGLPRLHAFEDGSGYAGEFTEIVMKGLVAAMLDGEIDVGKGVRHFVETDVLSIRIVGEFPEEMRPGQIDTVFADMSFERHLIRPVTVFVPEDADGPEIVEEIVFQSKSELYGGGADKQGHAFFGFDIDIIKFLDLDEMQDPV